jgi:hypothetical protein
MSTVTRIDPLHSEPGRIILRHIEERDISFVFPTQTAANSWAKAVVRHPGTDAVETERFLGWDKFREKLITPNIPADFKPADRHTRILWAMDALRRNEKRPFLHSLVHNAKQHTNAHVRLLVRMAPGLSAISDAISVRGESFIESNKTLFPDLEDYLSLARDYRRFCDASRLYEPSWIQPSSSSKGRFVAFVPDLMDAYAPMAEALRSTLGLEEFTIADKTEPLPLETFDTAAEETDWIFGTCRRLIEEGIAPSNICVSVPGLDASISAHLRRSAESFSVPVAFRFGKPLSRYGFGRMATALCDATRGLSLSVLRVILTDRSIPLKDPGSALALLRFAKKYQIPESMDDGEYLDELWRKTLKLCDPDVAILGFYEELRRVLDMIASCSDFQALSEALFAFRTSFLDEADIDEGVRENLETVFKELSGFVRESENPIPAISGLRPIDSFKIALDMALYTKAGQEEAVSVYPFGVAALAAFPIHFVMEASLDSIESVACDGSAFDAELNRELGLGPGSGRSEILLESYNAVSAIFCQATFGFSGYSAPHPRFSSISRDTTKSQRYEELMVDAEKMEQDAWRLGDPSGLPSALPPYLLRAAEGRFENGVFTPPIFRKNTDGPSLKSASPDAIVANLRSSPGFFKEGRVKFTPYSIKDFSQCSFLWFMNTVPGIDKTKGSNFDLLAGNLAHAVIADIVGIMARGNASIAAVAAAEAGNSRIGLNAQIESSIQAQIRRIAVKNGPAMEPALDAYRALLKARLEILLDKESLEDFEPGICEISLTKIYPRANAILEGRADRLRESLAEGGASCMLVDYKKKRIPTKHQCVADEAGRLEDFQIVSYIDMLEEIGKHVTIAMYWSIEDAKPLVIIGPSGARGTPTDFMTERAILEKTLFTATEKIMTGQILETVSEEKHCSDCPWKPVCRRHFATETP